MLNTTAYSRRLTSNSPRNSIQPITDDMIDPYLRTLPPLPPPPKRRMAPIPVMVPTDIGGGIAYHYVGRDRRAPPPSTPHIPGQCSSTLGSSSGRIAPCGDEEMRGDHPRREVELEDCLPPTPPARVLANSSSSHKCAREAPVIPPLGSRRSRQNTRLQVHKRGGEGAQARKAKKKHLYSDDSDSEDVETGKDHSHLCNAYVDIVDV